MSPLAKGEAGGSAPAGAGCGHVAKAVEQRWRFDLGFEPEVVFGKGLEVQRLFILCKFERPSLVCRPRGGFWKHVLGEDAEVGWWQWS